MHTPIGTTFIYFLFYTDTTSKWLNTIVLCDTISWTKPCSPVDIGNVRHIPTVLEHCFLSAVLGLGFSNPKQGSNSNQHQLQLQYFKAREKKSASLSLEKWTGVPSHHFAVFFWLLILLRSISLWCIQKRFLHFTMTIPKLQWKDWIAIPRESRLNQAFENFFVHPRKQ